MYPPEKSLHHYWYCTSFFTHLPSYHLETVLVIVLRYATLAYTNSVISADVALKQAYTCYSASDLRIKVDMWLAASPTSKPEVIIGFINSIPWCVLSSNHQPHQVLNPMVGI
jgi:hypothetical protein